MNVERLNALLRIIRDDLDRTQFPQRLEELSNALNNLIQSPHPSHQQAVATVYSATLNSAAASKLDALSPAWSNMLAEIGFENSIGSAAVNRLKEGFRSKDVTPQFAKDAVDALHGEVSKLSQAAVSAIAAFKALSLGFDRLDAGTSELGFMSKRSTAPHR